MAATSREKSLALVSRIVTAIDDKKATDIRVIDVSAQSGVTDFFIVATGAADQHLRGLRIEIERVLDEDGVKIIGVESQPESGWTVVDCFDVIVHLFKAEQRNNFQFEKLWKDGKELPSKPFITNLERKVHEQAVLITGNSKTPAPKKAVEKKPAPVAKKPVAAKKPVKAAAKPAKKAPAAKEPVVKAGVKAIVTGEARIVRRAAAKAKATRIAEENAAKTKTGKKPKPVKAAVKKIIAKKGAKAAKAVRGALKEKVKAAKVAKKAAPAAKAGVVTRKARKL